MTRDLGSRFEQQMQTARDTYRACNFVIAYSGGLDSQVLLHLCARIKDFGHNIRAVHVNHGIQTCASQWETACVAWAQSSGIDLTVVQLNLGEKTSETQARAARYDVFKAELGDTEVLLTAHHQNDQAETFLLRLMRRAGVVGLGGMRAHANVQGMQIFRPLLSVPKRELQDFILENQLKWIEDPSNLDTAIDRNYVRHCVLPRLVDRWSQAIESIDRVSGYCQEADLLCQDLGRLDYRPMVTMRYFNLCQQSTLCLKQLKMLASYRAKNAALNWLRDLGVSQFAQDDWPRIRNNLIQADDNARPEIFIGSFVLCRYQDQMVAVTEADFSRFKQSKYLSNDWRFSLTEPNQMPELKLEISLLHTHSNDCLSRVWLAQNEVKLTWRMRRPKDRFQPLGKPYAMQLKKLWQEAHVPYWCRDQVPMLVLNEGEKETIVAVVGLGVATLVHAQSEQDAVTLNLKYFI